MEYVEGVVEMDCRHSVTIQYPRQDHPQDFYYTYASGVDVRLWGQYDGMEGTLLLELNLV